MQRFNPARLPNAVGCGVNKSQISAGPDPVFAGHVRGRPNCYSPEEPDRGELIVVDLEKVSLTGTQQTALVTLYGKALDSRRPDSVLADRYLRLVQVLFRVTPIRRLGRGLRYHFGSARTGDV
jgi:hypothetical protein